MIIDDNTGLVLEGGGMRGVFTSGVLDAFMRHGLYFRYVVAVSAGACNGLSYMSRQPRRARASNIDLLKTHDYIGLRHLLRHGSIFDHKMMFEDLPAKLLPYDYDTYYNNPDVFEMVTTNCLTGKAMYLTEKRDSRRLLDIARASSSLPYVCRIVTVDGVPMLDGGIADSIPLERSISLGHERNVVILTRNRDYRKAGSNHKMPSFIYGRYPKLREALSRRNCVYNRQLDLVNEMERRGQVECIRPVAKVRVGRMEKDTEKLERLYDEGFSLGNDFCVAHGL